MAANEDFFVKFGSNASTWVTQLKAELDPAEAQVSRLGLALQALDRQGKKTADGLNKSLTGVAAEDAGKGRGVGGAGIDVSKINADLDQVSSEIRGIASGLNTLVNTIGRILPGMRTGAEHFNKQAAAQTRMAEGKGVYIDPATNSMIKNAMATQTPGAYRMGQAPTGQQPTLRQLGGVQQVQLAPVSMSALTKVQIDEAGFDRVVKAVIGVERAVKELGSRIRTGGETETPSPSPASERTPPQRAATRTQVTESATSSATEAAEAVDLEKQIRANLAEMNAERRQLIAALEEAGVEVTADMKQQLDHMETQANERKKQLAELERARTGETRGDQSARHKAEFASQPRLDLTREEYDRRMGIRGALAAPANEAKFRESVGRGAGQITKADLRAIAEAFRSAGFDPGLRAKDTNTAMVDKIVGARQAYSRQFAPGEFPEGLEVGVKPRMDPKVSESMRSILGALNEAGPAAERVEAAWETLRRSTQSGGDVVKPMVETAETRNPLGGPVMRGTIKGRPGVGGAIIDESEIIEARLEISQDRLNRERMGLARAAELARDPQWDAYNPALREGITGPSRRDDGEVTEAGKARIALARLKRAQDELDELGEKFQIFSMALDENAAFIDRATKRLDTDVERPDDRERLAGAEVNRERLLRERAALTRDDISGQEVPGLKDLFQSGEFWTGFQSRLPDREARSDAWQREQAGGVSNFLSMKEVMESSTAAVARSRLAGGTKDTYIRDIPGLRAAGGRYHFTPEHEKAGDPAEMAELNLREQQRVQAQRALARVDPTDAAALEKAQNHFQNKAIHFLNQVEKMFDIAPPLESLTNLPVRPQDQADELQRNARWQDARARAFEKPDKNTPEELFAGAQQAESVIAEKKAAAEQRLVRVTEQLAQTRETVAKAEREMVEGLDPSARARYDAALEQRAVAEKKAATLQGQIDRDLDLSLRRATRKYGDERDSETGAFKNPFKRDALGYDTEASVQIMDPDSGKMKAVSQQMGYGRNAATEELRKLSAGLLEAETEVRRAEDEINAAVGRETTEVDKLAREHRSLTTEVGSLGNALEDATAKVARMKEELKSTPEPKGGEAAKATEQEVAARSATEQARIDALKQERQTLQAGPHTVGDKRALAGHGDDPGLIRTLERSIAGQKAAVTRTENRGGDATEAKARLASKQKELEVARAQLSAATAAHERIKKINSELSALGARGKAAAGGAGAGDGGGGVTPPGGETPAGGDAGDLGVLRAILAAINAMHATLKGGLKIAGTVKTSGDGKAATAATTTPTAPKSGQPSVPGGGARLTDDQRRAQEAARAETRSTRQRLSETRIQADKIRLSEQEENLAKRREAAATRSTKSTQEQARADQRLAAAKQVLTHEAVEELAQLERLIKAGAESADVAHQQARAYNAVGRALDEQGVSKTDQRGIQQTLQSKALGRGVNATELGDIEKTASAVDGFKRVDRSMASGVAPGGIFGEQSQFTQAMFGNHGFWSRMMSSTGTFVVRNFAAGFVFGLTNALQEVIRQGIITESTFIRVSDALEQTGRSSGNLRTQLQSISSQYGTALNDVYMTAAGLTGLFADIDDIAGATKVVSQLQAISMGALNAQEAMGVLASITGAFGEELSTGVDGIEHVADVLTSIQNTLGTNVEVTSEGVGALSGLAKQLKIDFEDTAVYVAQIAKLTNQTGAAAGEQFGRILGSMQTGRGRGALAEALPDSGINTLIGQGEYGEAIKVLMREWDGLSESQQRNLTVTIAGQRQARAFAALMNNSTKVLNSSARAHDAQGEAAQRAEAIANTLNGQITRLGANLAGLAQNLIRTGVLNFFGLLLKVTNQVLSAVNLIFSTLNKTADNNPFLGMLRDMGAGLLGFLITLKIAQKAFVGFRASLAAMQAQNTVMGAGLTAAAGVGPAPTLRGGLTTLSTRLGQQGSTWADRGSADRAAPAPKATAAPRLFVVDSAGVATANKEIKESSRAYTAASKAATGASRATAGVSRGLNALAGAGLLAQVGILAVVAALVAAAGQMREEQAFNEAFQKRYDDMYGDDGKPKTPLEKERAYVGPFADSAQQRAKDTSGFGAHALWGGVTRPLQNLIDPSFHMDRIKALAGGDPTAMLQFGGMERLDRDYKRWRGILDEEMQGTLSGLRQEVEDALDEAEGGKGSKGFEDLWSTREKDTRRDPLGALLGGGQVRAKSNRSDLGNLLLGRGIQDDDLAVDEKLFEAPRISVEAAQKAQSEIVKKIEGERARIESSNRSGAQKARALGELEAMSKDANERVTALILAAQGIAEADILSMEQIGQINQLRGLFAQTQGTEVNIDDKMFGPMIESLIADTGVRPGSDMGKSLNRLAEGNMSSAEAMLEDQKALKLAIEQVGAKYIAMQSGEVEGMQEGDLEATKQELISMMTQMAGMTDALIQAFISESVALAEAARMRGDYAGARAALAAGLAQMGGQRDRASETDEVRAQRDVFESQQAQQAAEDAAQGKNTRLETSKAQTQSSVRDAQLDAQIAQNLHQALIAERNKAAAQGTQGPPVEAIRAAKRAWIQAEQNLTGVAASANIAQMAAAAAGIWNGIAAAQAQEGIALQQLADAKKTGDPVAIANAQGALAAASKSTVQTQDQVAQAQRDATLAAIPQGNAVAVAGQAVSNAQAALGAAQKYGANSVEYQGALAQLYSAQQQANQAQAAVTQAQASLAQAYAQARGDGVAAARAAVGVARAAMSAALAASGGARSAEVINAQAQLVSANAGVGDAILELITSRTQVAIALAEAAGHTVRAARLQHKAARQALAGALRKSGGERTAEVNNARASAISARAGARDAALQDRLDTIDFNLQMGRITQSSAISALREILRTRNLTKEQRRQLLLQIKGMKDEMANDQWNFGDIKLPTPYSMRRYIEQRRAAMESNINNAALQGGRKTVGLIDRNLAGPKPSTASSAIVNNYSFVVNGADTGKVERIIRDVVGGAGRTLTTQTRRR